MGTNEEGKHLVSLESIVPNLSLLKQYTPLIKQFWSNGLFEDMDIRYFNLIDRGQRISQILHKDLLNNFSNESLLTDFRDIFNSTKTDSYINKMTAFDQKTLLPALLQVEDRVSMSCSLEARVPFLDHRIIELTASIPPVLKFQGGKTKHLLKTISSDLLPKKILDRKDKMGFPVPLAKWMEGGIVKEFVADTLVSERSLNRGIFERNSIHKLVNEPVTNERKLWGALNIELWATKFID
jgi:asparagine synthase (glutamine-hydrolysing)